MRYWRIFALSYRHPYLPNTAEQKKELLSALGLKDIDDLFCDIPEKYLLKNLLSLPAGKPELEVINTIQTQLKKNRSLLDGPSFLGGGVWAHYIPTIVNMVAGRSEFVTSYTPYQAEISQGMLQTIFEYQSLLAELLDMDVVNASLYDWATGIGEAALMAARFSRRYTFLVPENIHPNRLDVLETYTEPAKVIIKQVAMNPTTGQMDLDDLKQQLTEEIAGVYIENPSYLGTLETQVEEISDLTHQNGSLFVVGVDPTSLGLIKPPGSYGADIVVGEAQPLGSPVSFGGPLLGILACRDDLKLIRQMAGRIMGMTTTLDGEDRGYVMTLATREQHIRRERATSNICSNEALMTVRSAIYLAAMGPEGMRQLSETCLYNAAYAQQELAKIPGIKSPKFTAPHFKEFVVDFTETGKTVDEVNKKLLIAGIQGGKALKGEFENLGESMLLCFTELHSKKDIDALVTEIRTIIGGN
jgi:glycine dehydrogenase subunit 1